MQIPASSNLDILFLAAAAFIIIFGATVLGAQMIALFLKRAASLLMLGPLDSLGGGVLGFLKGFVIVEALLIAAVTMPEDAM